MKTTKVLILKGVITPELQKQIDDLVFNANNVLDKVFELDGKPSGQLRDKMNELIQLSQEELEGKEK